MSVHFAENVVKSRKTVVISFPTPGMCNEKKKEVSP